MKRAMLLAALAVALGGCAGADHYPISRELARPDDPVHRMEVPPLPDTMDLG
jgi:hypothetical protein